MKLVLGFITYNESSSVYLPHFLPSLKEALSFLANYEYLILAFDNSDRDKRDNEKILDNFFQENKEIQIEKIISPKNLGFSAPYNQMIAKARDLGAEFFLLINPDVLLEKDSLKILLDNLLARPSLMAVCPRLMAWDFLNNQKTDIIDSLGISLKPALKFADIGQGRKYTSKNNNYFKEKMLAPSGAAALYRIKALEAVCEIREGKKQYFDERFFMYKEDCDLGLRLFKRGLESQIISEAVFYHDRSAKLSKAGPFSSLFSRKSKSKQVRSWSFRNQHYIFVKHFKYQTRGNKMLIIARISYLFIFSLLFEQFLLKEYGKIIKFIKEERKSFNKIAVIDKHGK